MHKVASRTQTKPIRAGPDRQRSTFENMQLDLFTHSRDVVLRNEVIAALRLRDPVLGGQTLARLSAEYPQDSLLMPLAALLDTLATPSERFPDHHAVADALHTMETVVTPSAHRVFGPQEARAWLAPVWRSLTNSARELSFDPERPHVHAAALLLRTGDWAAAEAQVAAIPSWRRIPAPLAWMTEARFGQGGLEAAWFLLVELAWIDASRFGALARRLEAPALRKLLDDFDVGFDADGETDFAWFPAWVLIIEPALGFVLRETQACRDTAPERAARLIMELLTLERQGRHADLVAQRKRLRDLHPGLFSRYMSTR